MWVSGNFSTRVWKIWDYIWETKSKTILQMWFEVSWARVGTSWTAKSVSRNLGPKSWIIIIWVEMSVCSDEHAQNVKWHLYTTFRFCLTNPSFDLPKARRNRITPPETHFLKINTCSRISIHTAGFERIFGGWGAISGAILSADPNRRIHNWKVNHSLSYNSNPSKSWAKRTVSALNRQRN